MPLRARYPGVDQRQRHVLKSARTGQQVEGLEDEADFAVTDLGQLIVVEMANVGPLQEVLACSGLIETADDIHERGLARARRPHNGDHLAGAHLECDAAQSVDFDLTHLVDFGDVLDVDDRCLHHRISSIITSSISSWMSTTTSPSSRPPSTCTTPLPRTPNWTSTRSVCSPAWRWT